MPALQSVRISENEMCSTSRTSQPGTSDLRQGPFYICCIIFSVKKHASRCCLEDCRKEYLASWSLWAVWGIFSVLVSQQSFMTLGIQLYVHNSLCVHIMMSDKFWWLSISLLMLCMRLVALRSSMFAYTSGYLVEINALTLKISCSHKCSDT